MPTIPSSSPPPQSDPTAPLNLTICSWNRRGLHNSIPYIQYLVSKEVDIIVLQEHWLWPFQLPDLKSISPSYSHAAVCDQRLNSSSDLRRGCGGVAILWKKTLHASPTQIDSDRICGLQVPLKDSPPLIIFGVYMPSADQLQEAYSSCLENLSRHVLQSTRTMPDAPVIITGDRLKLPPWFPWWS